MLNLAIRARGVAGRRFGSRGTCRGGRRRPGDAGYARLELSSAGHGDGDGRGVGSLPRRREEAEEGKTEGRGNPRVGAGLYRRKGGSFGRQINRTADVEALDVLPYREKTMNRGTALVGLAGLKGEQAGDAH